MQENPEVITIPKEDAVFWLDDQGRWKNEHGLFEHPKVSTYFHTCIKKDEQGYYVGQQRDAVYEKVYFRYEDTALFVFRVEIETNVITFKLNTGRQVELKPTSLFTRNDNLYLQTAQGPAKFSQQSLLEISKLMDDDDGQLFIKTGEARFRISEQA